MTVLTVNNLPAATHGETVRCLFAIEMSGLNWVIAFNTPLSEKISRRTLTGCKWKRLLELIEEVRARVGRETGRAVEVISCYEAGYDGFWLHRQLSAHGISNYVIDPASLQVDRRARRVKTDRIDAERLLRSLMAYLRGEPKVWSVVRVPSVAEEDARRLRRERDRLVSETRSACQPHQGALRAPRHLRLQSVTPAGDSTAGAIAHDARRRIAAAAKIRDQAGIAASGACG